MPKKIIRKIRKVKRVNKKNFYKEIYNKGLNKNMKKTIEKVGVKNVISSLYFLIFFYVIYSIFITFIITYIRGIKDCPCFLEKNKQVGANITYIYILEIIYLIVTVMNIISSIIAVKVLKSKQKGGDKMNISNRIGYLIGLIIGVYLLYNIYKLSQIPEDDCDCDKNSLKYLLYIQGVLIFISLIYSTYVQFS